MIGTLVRHAKLLVGPVPIQSTLVEGLLKQSGTHIRASYSGSSSSLAFITDLLFDSHRATPDGADTDCALHIVERSPAMSLFDGNAADVRVPAWINQYVDLAGKRAAKAPLFGRHLRREVERRIRRGGYTLDFSTADADRRRFFHEMYQPYVQARFNQQAILVSEHQFMRLCAGQTLARLYSHGAWIAGLLLGRRGQSLKFGWFGATQSPPAPGASEVLDALVIRWADAQGLQRAILGHSRPSLRDGVLRYKRRFGSRIRATPFPQPQICIEVKQPSDAVARCLDHAALIRIQDGRAFTHRIESKDGTAVTRLEEVPDELL